MTNFVHYFSHSAGEFAEEAWFSIVEQIAIHEGKTYEQVVGEIEGHWEEREIQGSLHPFQTWGSCKLLDRINASQEK